MSTTVARPTGPVARPRSRAGLPPGTVGGVVAAGGAAVVGLWLAALEHSGGPGAVVTEAGRLAGLLGGYACVVLVVLMARLPALERGVGADRLARWHSRGGRWTIGLLAAHALLVLVGYTLTGHAGLVPEAVTLVLDYPDVLMATVALALLLGVAAVSARTARRRLSYETWYWLHFYTYLALALAFLHAFRTGSAFVDDLPARVFWSLLYGVAGVAVAWRLAVPASLALRHRVRIAAVRREAPGVASVELVGTGLERLGAQAGQFVRLRVLDRQGWWQSHPYSLSAPVTDSRLRVTVKALGDESARLLSLRPGTPVALEGPYGALTAARRTRRKVLLLGAGIGITPLRALFQEMVGDREGDVLLVHRASTPRDLVHRAEVDRLAGAHPSRVAHHVVGPRGGPRDVTHVDGLLALVPDAAERDVFLCGPRGFLDAVHAALRAAGVPEAQVHEEAFALDDDEGLLSALRAVR